jgi:hypothetical protein
VVHATREAEIRRIKVPGMMVLSRHPSDCGKHEIGGSQLKSNLGKSKSLSKITIAKKDWKHGSSSTASA